MRNAALVFVGIAFGAVAVFCCQAVTGVAVKPVANAKILTRDGINESNPDQNKTLNRQMVFSTDGLAGRLQHTAEGVAGSGNARISVIVQGQARLICILTTGIARNYSLDEGLEPAQFAFIRSQHFTPPDSHVLQTMSIFRSLARTEMKFSAQQGDRVIVLMCPKEEWSSLQLQWPEDLTTSQ